MVEEVGRCPRCGGTNLNYGVIGVDGEQIYYPWTCEECGAKGKEWHMLTFSGHTDWQEKEVNYGQGEE